MAAFLLLIELLMYATIITIGEEILIGQIVDTNSAWMGYELNKVGVKVRQIISIPDIDEQIKSTVNQSVNDSDIVLITGGLGPTNDDITKQALCQLFGSELVVHGPTLEHIRQIFAKRGLPLTELNSKQAEIPSICEVLHNPLGTAPGMWFDINSKIVVSMPGVPFEMKGIMQQHVLPRLDAFADGVSIVHKTIQTFGLPESFLAERLNDWEANMPRNINVAYLPNPISIRIRLSSSGNSKELIELEIQKQIDALLKLIPNNIFGYENDTMASVVGDLLVNNSLMLAVAESCTGGTIAHLITHQSGSSRYFLGGVVAYSNDVKVSALGVDSHLIETYGAVSQQVVESMAQGVMLKLGSDYGIATSGIAGPTGGTPGKPVGTVWVAVSSKQGVVSERFSFGSDRERNILRSSVSALNMLRLLILSEKKIQ